MDDVMKGQGPVLVIAPHPDDEILGAGGTMARLTDQGRAVHVCIVTCGRPPAFSAEQTKQVRDEARAAHAHLGITQTHWLDLPAAGLAELPHSEMNAKIGELVARIAPDLLLIPHVGDIHMDHQLVFLSALVASRPHQDAYPATILAYETLSETNWNAPYLTPPFVPTVFVDVSATLDRKLEAFALYESQVRHPPHERSVDTLRALATLRGATVHRHACEAFVLVRHVS